MNPRLRQEAAPRPLWVPPAAGAGALFSLFLTATLIRRSPIADAARGLMIVLSTAAAVAIAIYGVKMVVEARARGIASAIAGLVMVAMGVYTTIHVLK